MLVYQVDLEDSLSKALAHSGQLQEAGRLRPASTLEARMSYLDNYANHESASHTVCWLFPDWAPMSFAFTMYSRPWVHADNPTIYDVRGILRTGETLQGWYDAGQLKRALESLGYRQWFFGGLIFHGAHDRGGDGGAPSFSMCLTPVSGWSVHT